MNRVWCGDIKFGARNVLWGRKKICQRACSTNHLLAVSSETLAVLSNFFYGSNSFPITLRAVVDLRELCVHLIYIYMKKMIFSKEPKGGVPKGKGGCANNQEFVFFLLLAGLIEVR